MSLYLTSPQAAGHRDAGGLRPELLLPRLPSAGFKGAAAHSLAKPLSPRGAEASAVFRPVVVTFESLNTARTKLDLSIALQTLLLNRRLYNTQSFFNEALKIINSHLSKSGIPPVNLQFIAFSTDKTGRLFSQNNVRSYFDANKWTMFFDSDYFGQTADLTRYRDQLAGGIRAALHEARHAEQYFWGKVYFQDRALHLPEDVTRAVERKAGSKVSGLDVDPVYRSLVGSVDLLNPRLLHEEDANAFALSIRL